MGAEVNTAVESAATGHPARRTGVAVVGLGMAAKPHALALKDLAAIVDMRAVYSRNPVERERFAAAYGFPAAGSVEEIAADPGVAIVMLLTPPNARADLVRLFAGAGKHILMEKPVERTTVVAERIVTDCEAAGVSLGIVLQQRFREEVIAARQLLAGGRPGRLAAIRVAVPWWREQSYYDVPGRGSFARDGGGVLISQAIHTLDLMLLLAGPVADVQAIAGTSILHRMESEDFVAAGLRFANGAWGSLVATTAAFPGEPESIVLDCEHASLRLDVGTLTVRWRGGRTETEGGPAASGGGADPMAFSHRWQRALISDFVSSVRDGRPPAVTARQALPAHRLIDALLRSAALKQAVAVAQEHKADVHHAA